MKKTKQSFWASVGCNQPNDSCVGHVGFGEVSDALLYIEVIGTAAKYSLLHARTEC